jgi:uncharacterized membrane protein
MTTDRLETFSDGVIAIIITVMVLELPRPDGTHLHALRHVWPVLLTYVLSFVIIGIYWNNHHHMLRATKRINGTVLWANLHLLFWLSLFPFGTGWMGENHFARVPTAAYGVVLLMAAIAYYVLQLAIIRGEGPSSTLKVAIGRDVKGKASPLIYAVSIGLALVNRWLAVAGYVLVALMWLVPDRRLESRLQEVDTPQPV